jgi:hypothetical protein
MGTNGQSEFRGMYQRQIWLPELGGWVSMVGVGGQLFFLAGKGVAALVDTWLSLTTVKTQLKKQVLWTVTESNGDNIESHWYRHQKQLTLTTSDGKTNNKTKSLWQILYMLELCDFRDNNSV